MPKDDINYKFTENGIVYDFYDVFVPAENFRQPTLFTWGSNNRGQLGTNDTTTKNTPVTTFAGGTNWKQISCGDQHTLAIKTDGTLWIWGYNGYGGLGLNFSGPERSTPVTTFAGGNNWKSVAAGLQHSAAIKTDGTLWCWGEGGRGQLGNFNSGTRFTPVTTFAGGTNWKQVACGEYFTAAIKTDGTLWTWGGDPEANNRGQLGINDTTNRSTPVTTFAGGTNWKQVVCGLKHTAAIKTDGSLWTWGANGGALGTNDTNNRTTPVTTFAGGNTWKSVSCGGYHTAAIKTDGTLWTWGGNGNIQLGDNTTATRLVPVTTFAGGTNWKQIACGGRHTAAIKTDGTLWVWGRNNNGQIGINNYSTPQGAPVTTFAGGNNWKQVSGGGSHTSAIQYQPDP